MNTTLAFPVLALAALAASGCTRAHSAPPEPPQPEVQGNRLTLPAEASPLASAEAQAVQRDAVSRSHFNGRIVWNEDATVRIYSPVEGRVREIDANLGDSVVVHAPLARIDSSDFGQALAEARKADADARLAQQTCDREKLLFENGAAARKDVDAAEDALAGALAEQQRARLRLQHLGASTSDAPDQLFTLTSPVAGLVVERNVNLGQELRPDLMLANAPQLLAPQFVVSDPRRMWVLLDVVENDIALLQPNARLRVTSRAFPGREFRGALESVGIALDPATRTVKARGWVDNQGLQLRAEMYVDVELETPAAASSVVAIASTAVVTKDDHSFVFVETAPRSYERREVRVGAESGGRVFLLSGVSAGERVLVEGSLQAEEIIEAANKS